ncbi:MAG: hypothetical protein JWQ79_670 [Mucilaginibacter sp.]|jgi:hypothetical protein|nr:hypothetical protein [Mucilaginibacter sp.]
MTNNINHYNGSHYVLLTLEKDTRVENTCSSPTGLNSHLQYYQRLRKSGKLISYGEVMNRPAICIILLVSSADDFEQIIQNDPALKSGAFKIENIMPFINNNAIPITNKMLHVMAEL